jgi:hypothetical protein
MTSVIRRCVAPSETLKSPSLLRLSTAEGLVKQESSDFQAVAKLKALDPSFRWDDERDP